MYLPIFKDTTSDINVDEIINTLHFYLVKTQLIAYILFKIQAEIDQKIECLFRSTYQR